MPTKTARNKNAPKAKAPTRPTKAAAGATDAPAREALNVAVVRGVVSSPPERRVLPSDTVLVQLQVTTRLESETLSMPVSCWNPDSWVEDLESGDEIVVVGRVRRRFFRAGGATASRVELEADVVARASDRRRVRAVVRRALATLGCLDP
jgi:single-strand DNA-binding protein